MKMYTYRGPSREPGGEIPPLAPGVSSVRFGGETLLYIEEEREPGGAAGPGAHPAAAAAPSRGARLPQRHEEVDRDEMHVVVQNGRLFQQHHPEIPVIHDRGRFLLVKLDPSRAADLAAERRTCYGVMPLTEDAVVFDEPAPPAARAPAPFVKALVDGVRPAQIKTSLVKLVSFGTRHSTSSGFRDAAAWARQRLEASGYQTRVEDVALDSGASANVIADKPGEATSGRQVVLVTAHLDSINLKGGPAAPAPGADDNASGSAGLLEIARVLRGHRGRHDLRLILFGGEEQGLFGSRQYVRALSAAERSRVRAVINMDMVGRLNSDTRSVLLEGAQASRDVIEQVRQAAATFTQLRVEVSLHPFASDHVPFIDAGLPALLAIEGADNTNEDVHSERDALAHVDYAFEAEILRMIVGFTAEAVGAAG